MTDLIKIVIRNMSDSTMHALIQAHQGDFVLFPLRRFAAFQKVDAAAAAFLKQPVGPRRISKVLISPARAR